MGRVLAEGDQTVEDDQFDVVVALFDDKVDVAGGGSTDGGGGRREGDEGAGGLVTDRRAARVEQVVDASGGVFEREEEKRKNELKNINGKDVLGGPIYQLDVCLPTKSEGEALNVFP